MNENDTSDSRITRRRLLGSTAAVGGMAAASLALPPNIRKALANPAPKNGRLKDIEHVVVLMLENRSFDHYFGTLSGVRGFSDPNALRLSTGRPVFYQPDPSNPDGYLLPYRLNTRISAAQIMPSTSHAWTVQHQAWNDGAMDGFVTAHLESDGKDGPFTMGYFTREDIPFHHALADAFTLCDGYHCSVLGPTHPNRYMYMSGTIDPDGEFGGPALDNNAGDNVYSWTTYPERLSEAGVSWRFYQEAEGVHGPPTGLPVYAKMTQYQKAAKDENSALYKYALNPVQPGQFEYDAMNDKLPTVSWLMPPRDFDEHPARMPAAGALWVSGKIDALAANPDVWAKTVFIMTYDENDGLFDHVQPPTPPAGTPDEFVTKTSPAGTVGGGLPVGPGFRVPTIIVSPWTAGGWVSSEPSDHTSILRFLERITGVVEPNISDYRRRTLGDLTSALRLKDATKQIPDLPETATRYNLARYEAAALPLPTAPTANQTMPKQERGNRPHTR